MSAGIEFNKILALSFQVLSTLQTMGKHKNKGGGNKAGNKGGSNKNKDKSAFKVAGSKVTKAKSKAKPVTTNLKRVGVK